MDQRGAKEPVTTQTHEDKLSQSKGIPWKCVCSFSKAAAQKLRNTKPPYHLQLGYLWLWT